MANICITAPERLTAGHDLAAFANEIHPSLDEWLRDRALASEGHSARTYVVCDAGQARRVVGYYSITTALAQRSALPFAKLRRDMPDQVPLLLIGRLAVDTSCQGIGLGADLLVDALRRCAAASEIAGARGVIVHAIDSSAAAFYVRHGFIPSTLGELVFLLPIETVRMLSEPDNNKPGSMPSRQ